MNGQYQQPLDSLNNDNKYVGLQGLGAGCVGILRQLACPSLLPVSLNSLPPGGNPTLETWCEDLPRRGARPHELAPSVPLLLLLMAQADGTSKAVTATGDRHCRHLFCAVQFQGLSLLGQS